MIADNVKAFNNSTLNNDLKFFSKIENNKLFINALSQDHKFQYLGEFVNQDMDLEDFKELIDEEKLKIVSKTESIVKIKVGGMPIQLIRVIKEEPKNQILIIQDLLKNHEKLESQIKQQKDELNLQKIIMKQFQIKIESFILNANSEIILLKQAKQNLGRQYFTIQKMIEFQIKSDKQFKDIESLFENEKKARNEEIQIVQQKIIKNFENQISEIRKLIDSLKINQQKKSQKNLTINSISVQDQLNLQKKILNNTNQINQIKINLNQKFEFFKWRLSFNNILIENLRKEFQVQQDKFAHNSATVSQHSEQLKKLKNKLTETSITVTQHSVRLQKYEDELKTFSTKILQQNTKLQQHENKITSEQNIMTKMIYRLDFLYISSNFSSFENYPITSSIWDEEMKSKAIAINGNIITLTKTEKKWHFCLLDAAFSILLNIKQSWAIRISQKKGYSSYLGVCLKSKMEGYNFNTQDIKWSETGHGLYLIGSDGSCDSHSHQEFNQGIKSFQFDEGDVIICEFDPIECKLRFNKNRIEYFEMPIIAPPQDDDYHPCVLLGGQNNIYELIQPQFLQTNLANIK